MKTLSLDDLTIVTGGKTVATSTNTSSGGDDQLLTTLRSIQSSISDLGKNQNNSLFGGANGLMFMTMALAMGNRGGGVVVCANRCRRGSGRW